MHRVRIRIFVAVFLLAVCGQHCATAFRFMMFNANSELATPIRTSRSRYVEKPALQGFSNAANVAGDGNEQVGVPDSVVPGYNERLQKFPIRRGPLGECESHQDCRERLLTYFNSIMKMNKAGR